jgi:hypothetical protein
MKCVSFVKVKKEKSLTNVMIQQEKKCGEWEDKYEKVNGAWCCALLVPRLCALFSL